MVQQDDHEGLRQIRNLTKDLCGQNVVLLNSTVLREMLNITIDIRTYIAIAMSLSVVVLLCLFCYWCVSFLTLPPLDAGYHRLYSADGCPLWILAAKRRQNEQDQNGKSRKPAPPPDGRVWCTCITSVVAEECNIVQCCRSLIRWGRLIYPAYPCYHGNKLCIYSVAWLPW